MSMYGARDQRPSFQSSYARSIISTVSVTCISPRMLGESFGMAGKRGRPSRAMFNFPEEPRILKFRTCRRNSSGRSFASMVSRKVRRTSRLEMTSRA